MTCCQQAGNFPIYREVMGKRIQWNLDIIQQQQQQRQRQQQQRQQRQQQMI